MGGVAVLIARLSLKVKVDPVALVIRLSLQLTFFFFIQVNKNVIFKNKKTNKFVRHKSFERSTVCFFF